MGISIIGWLLRTFRSLACVFRFPIANDKCKMVLSCESNFLLSPKNYYRYGYTSYFMSDIICEAINNVAIAIAYAMQKIYSFAMLFIL